MNISKTLRDAKRYGSGYKPEPASGKCVNSPMRKQNVWVRVTNPNPPELPEAPYLICWVSLYSTQPTQLLFREI